MECAGLFYVVHHDPDLFLPIRDVESTEEDEVGGIIERGSADGQGRNRCVGVAGGEAAIWKSHRSFMLSYIW